MHDDIMSSSPVRVWIILCSSLALQPRSKRKLSSSCQEHWWSCHWWNIDPRALRSGPRFGVNGAKGSQPDGILSAKSPIRSPDLPRIRLYVSSYTLQSSSRPRKPSQCT